MAIVIDEHWWVDWLVTLEDIVEEVFWEIQDETDQEDEKIIKVWKNKILTNWSVAFKDILDFLDLTIYDIVDENINVTEYLDENINYLINDILDRFPKNWDDIKLWDILELRVKEVKWKVINNLEIEVLKSEEHKN